MSVYTADSVAKIIGYANGTGGYAQAGLGDVVIVPENIYDCSATKLSFAAGARWIGAGRGQSVITGRVQATLAGSRFPLWIKGISFNSDELGVGTFTYGSNELADGVFILIDTEFYGGGAGDVLTFVANDYPCIGIMSRCVSYGAFTDCIATDAPGGATVAAQSKLLLLDCEAYTPGSHANDQCLTSHDGFKVYDYCGYYHGAVIGQTIAQANEASPIRCYGTRIEHAGTNSAICAVDTLYRCQIVGAAANNIAYASRIAEGNRMRDGYLGSYGTSGVRHIRRNIFENGGVYVGENETYPLSSTAILRIDGNLCQDATTTNYPGVAVGVHCTVTGAGHIDIRNNVSRGCQRGFSFQTVGSPTIRFENNLAYRSGVYAAWQYGLTGSITWLPGGYNHLHGSLLTYTPQSGDTVTKPTPAELAAWVGRVPETEYDRASVDAMEVALDREFGDATDQSIAALPALVVAGVEDESGLLADVYANATGLMEFQANTAITLADIVEDTSTTLPEFITLAVGAIESGASAEELLAAIQAYLSGTGSNTVVITITDGVDPIEGVSVKVTKGAETHRNTTDELGTVTFGLADGTWQVTPVNSLYDADDALPIALIVPDDGDPTYTMSAIAIPSSDAGLVTGYIYCRDNTGELIAGVSITRRFIKTTSGFGTAMDSTPETQTSDVNGRTTFQNLLPGGEYRFKYGEGPEEITVKIPADATTPYELDILWGVGN